MEIIVSAKDRQAAEANKYASILLEELDLEKSREERKKVSIAKKREKRKKKKKEKQEREREQKEKGTSRYFFSHRFCVAAIKFTKKKII